jgi:HD-GYP domain-containing protein (c-di-GMP phosphodiesterase class II)
LAGPPVRRGRILASLLLLLLTVGVLPLLGTAWNLVSTSRDIMELDQKSIQIDKARSLSQQVSVFVQSLRSQVAAIARTLELDTNGQPFAARVQRIKETNGLVPYVSSGRFDYVSVVDASGSGAQSGFQLQEPLIQQMLQEGFKTGLAGKPYVSKPVVSTSLKEPVLMIAEPVRRGDQVEGVVIVIASLGRLWTMTREMAQEGAFDVYVVDDTGHLVAHSDPQRLDGNLDLKDVEIVKQFLETHGRTAATVPFTLKGPNGPLDMLGTYTGVADDSGWGVIVQIDEAKAYYTALRMRNQSVVLVALVTIAAIVLGTLFAGQISHPIQELAASARRLARGDYTTRVRVRATNEVGLLGDTFNTMSEEIQKAIEEIRRTAETNKQLFRGSIRMLANAIDEKDPYTRGHSERVAFYSQVMARHLGMSEEDVEKVHLSGIIHDVGKIGIEDKILRKAGALTEEEYEIMKQHPRKGEHILDAVPLLKEMAGPGLMHHENWDGSGYPDGLKGEQIPLLGRIVSVADAFDAMTTDRPYSKAMTFEEALKRLRFLAAKKFDDGCVGAIEKAFAAGDLTSSSARKAAIASRKKDETRDPAPASAVL